MIRRLLALVILAALPAAADLTSENDDVVVALKEILTIDIASHWYADVRSKLTASGLSGADADRIVSELAADAKECVFAAIAKAMDRHSVSIDDIPRESPQLDMSFFFDSEDEFGELVVACVSLAVEKAGLLED